MPSGHTDFSATTPTSKAMKTNPREVWKFGIQVLLSRFLKMFTNATSRNPTTKLGIAIMLAASTASTGVSMPFMFRIGIA